MKTKSSEQKIQIDNTEQAIDILKKWFEEDKDNRGFIILTSYRGEKVDDEYAYGGNFSLFGMDEILTAGLVKCMSHSDNPLTKILRKALEFILFRKKEREQN